MTVQLTNEEKVKFFHNALCNGLGYIRAYGLEVIIDKTTYLKAKVNAPIQKFLSKPCYEDVLIQILNEGDSFTIRDNESEEDHIITMELVLSNMEKVPTDHLMDMENEQDDAITADVIIQSVIFGEVIYG
jgi:hypothetical protein